MSLGPAAAAPPKVEPIKLNPTSVVVPLGESRNVTVSGTLTPEALLVEGDPAVASASLEGRKLVVRGQGSGDTTVALQQGGQTVRLKIAVRPWAARLPKQVSLSLTGPMDADSLREALTTTLLDIADLHPRARLRLNWGKQLPAGPGDYTVDVEASGLGLLAASQKAMVVHLARPEVTLAPTRVLALSNHPEKIAGTGLVFDRQLPNEPVRLLYHHRNLPEHPERSLEVVLLNPSGEPRKVLVSLASVGPSQDEIYAGHLAAFRFVTRALNNQGVVLTVPAQGSRTIDRLDMKSGQTVSGMAALTPLGPGMPLRLQVRVLSETEPYQNVNLGEAQGVTNGRTAAGLFPSVVERSAAHLVGARYTYINLGDNYVKDIENGSDSPGNFGTLYRIRLTLTNPDPEPREVTLKMTARGGPARGLLFVDGQWMETPMIGASALPITSWTLQPGEVRQVYIETFPQSGSNYPVFLEVSSPFSGRAEPDQAPSADWEIPRSLP